MKVSKPLLLSALALWSPFLICSARAQKAEDQDIPDEDVPAQPAPAKPVPAKPVPSRPSPTKPADVPAQTTPVPSPPVQAQPAPSNGETVTIPRAELDALRAQQAEMQRQIDELKRIVGNTPGSATPGLAAPSSEPSPETGEPAPSEGGSPEPSSTEPVATSGNRNYLLLPDISFIGQAKGLLSTDRRDANRGSLRLSEGELGIQSYVYPNVKADAFITGAPAENQPFQLEEGYLTFLNFRPGLSINVGRKFTPFGRTGQLHNHSWLYTRQLIPFRNLVAAEALTGDGVNFSYLLPTGKKLFAQLDLGIWNGEGAGTVSSKPFGQELPNGSGSGFYDRFRTARLWLSRPIGENSEFELGTSYARGRSAVDDDGGIRLASGRTTLNGLDMSYRHYMTGGRRLLLRTEYFRNSPNTTLQSALRRADGYYGLANFRFSPYQDLGLLYENSGFPQGLGARENALSLILTKQLTEQFYIRLQGTHGNRPGDGGYNAAQLQFVWGVGPHTHALE